MKEKLWDEDDAAHYDDPMPSQAQFDAIRAILDVLVEFAGDGPALEFAIGTGRIGLPLAARGVRVVGLENSTAMAGRLREKDPDERVPVTIGDMATERVAGSFQLVYLVFNTIGNLTTQERQVACFANAAAHLRPGGFFLIENTVPDLRRLPPGARTPASSLMPRDMSATTATPISWLNRPCRITSSPAATLYARARSPGASCGHRNSISWRGWRGWSCTSVGPTGIARRSLVTAPSTFRCGGRCLILTQTTPKPKRPDRRRSSPLSGAAAPSGDERNGSDVRAGPCNSTARGGQVGGRTYPRPFGRTKRARRRRLVLRVPGCRRDRAVAPESHEQKSVVTKAAASAPGAFVRGGYATVYDGVVGPWFLPTFADATRLNELDSVVLVPPVETCVQRVLTRQGYGFTDEAATRKMHAGFASAQISQRHVIHEPPDEPGEVVAMLEALRSTGDLRFKIG